MRQARNVERYYYKNIQTSKDLQSLPRDEDLQSLPKDEDLQSLPKDEDSQSLSTGRLTTAALCS